MFQGTEKLVFFDLETAGLKTDAAIIQIAAIAVDDRLREIDSFETKIRFDLAKASTKSLEISLFEPTIWKRLAKKPGEAAYEFGDFLRRHATVDMISKDGRSYHVAQLVAHNAAFDGPIIQSWYERRKTFLPASRRVLCTLQRAVWLFQENKTLTPPTDYKLGTLCNYFGIQLGEGRAHDAVEDVKATAQLYRALYTSHALQKAA